MTREFQFYIVPTPIGNFDDITLRALEILKKVDIIACEDSRTTQNLLNHFDIKTKLVSYHKFNEKSRVNEFINILNEGKTIALVSDAGTPMICDPGSVLIKELIKNNVTITALPGASAITTFLSATPRENEIFTFVGFFPKTAQKAEEIIKTYSKDYLLFYESPKRIINTLKSIKELRGNIKVSLGRELTKLFEEYNTDTIDNVINRYSDNIKGEIICMLHPENEENFEILSKINILKTKGFKTKEIAIILSELFNLNKNDIYNLMVKD